MELKCETVGGLKIVLCEEETIENRNARRFKRELSALISDGEVAVLDMSRVRFVDSSGLGALLWCLRRQTSSGGDLKLSGMSRPVRALFELVRMHKVIEIYNDREEAIRACDGFPQAV